MSQRSYQHHKKWLWCKTKRNSVGLHPVGTVCVPFTTLENSRVHNHTKENLEGALCPQSLQSLNLQSQPINHLDSICRHEHALVTPSFTDFASRQSGMRSILALIHHWSPPSLTQKLPSRRSRPFLFSLRGSLFITFHSHTDTLSGWPPD